MRLFNDDKIVFPPGKGIVSLFCFLFTLLSTFGQSNINNFGAADFVKSYSGYPKFDLIDFNGDGIEDIFLFGNQQKNFVIHEGLKESKFGPPIWKFFFFPIDDIKWLTESSQGDDYYVFASRNRRLTGLVSFTKSNSLQLLHTVEFNSYPSNIELTDLDSNGTREALVFGNNFDGIVLLRNEGFRLRPDTLYKESVFSDLIIFDFNQDEVADIIAIDALNNSINFLENTEIGGFFSTRTIVNDQTLYTINISDLNGDSFEDLVIAKEGGFEVMFGDSVYSYKQSVQIDLSFTPLKLICNDLNNNLDADFILLNTIENSVNINFDFMKNDFQVEYPLSGISDLKLNENKTKTELFLLSKEGRFQILGNIFKWSEDFHFTPGGFPGIIRSVYDEENNDYSFITKDRNDNKISILNLNYSGSFKDVKNIELRNEFQDFVCNRDLSTIAGYSFGKRLVELVINKIPERKYKSSYMYTKYGIKEIFVDHEDHIRILSQNNNMLYYESLSRNNESYISEEIVYLDSSAMSATQSTDGKAYYWLHDNNRSAALKSFKEEKGEILKLEIQDTLDNHSIIIPDQNIGNGRILSFFIDGGKQHIHMIENNKIVELQSEYDFPIKNDSSASNFKYFSNILDGSFLFTYFGDQNLIKQFSIDPKRKSISFVDNIAGIKSSNYIIGKYYDTNYIVFPDIERNCITFKTLDE